MSYCIKPKDYWQIAVSEGRKESIRFMKQQIIRFDTVRNQVYQFIRQNIADGLYHPGDRLNEQQIAEDLNVSRSPVREAIKQLTGDGFVIYVQNKGSFVRQLTRDDLNDMYDMRVMIESYAIRRACQELRPEIRLELQDYYDKFPKYHAEKILSAYAEVDKGFHSAIVLNSGNQYAIDMFNNLYILMSLFRTISLSDAELFRLSLRDHMKMIEYIMEGNADQAIRIVRIHLQNGKEMVDLSLPAVQA